MVFLMERKSLDGNLGVINMVEFEENFLN